MKLLGVVQGLGFPTVRRASFSRIATSTKFAKDRDSAFAASSAAAFRSGSIFIVTGILTAKGIALVKTKWYGL